MTEMHNHKKTCNGSDCPRGIGVIVVFNGLVLSSQRKKKDGSLGHWQFPGGRVESNETCVEAAVRELKEETGMLIPAERLIPTFHNVPSIGFENQEYNACSFILELTLNDVPANPEPDKHTDWVWLEPTHFARIENVLPRTRQALHQAFKLHTELFVPL